VGEVGFPKPEVLEFVAELSGFGGGTQVEAVVGAGALPAEAAVPMCNVGKRQLLGMRLNQSAISHQGTEGCVGRVAHLHRHGLDAVARLARQAWVVAEGKRHRRGVHTRLAGDIRHGDSALVHFGHRTGG